MGKNRKDNSIEAIRIEFEEKIDRLKKTVYYYKNELQNLAGYKTELKIFHDLSIIFASSETFDDLFKRTMEILSKHLKARYYGVFWINDEKDMFEYRYGKGYKPGLMSAIPRIGSLMGESLYKRDIVWEPDIRSKGNYIPLNQEPGEYNVLCAPIVLFGNDTGAIRLANIDPDSQEVGIKMLKTVNPLLCSSLERMQLQHQNKKNLMALEASFTIARSLESTLAEGEIIKKVCSQVPKLFACKACIIAIISENGIKHTFSWPADFYLGGNTHSSTIYLRNLLEAFPTGTALIKNIHKDKRWAWPLQSVRSICTAGLHVQKMLKGLIIAVGPNDEIYNRAQQNLLGLVAAQTSITMERASYFRKQEEMASRDGLTGLLNHRMFQEILRVEIARMKRYEHPLSFIMFDIDNFKKFNDTYGHPVGDEIIKMVSLTTRSCMRITDRVFRYGGEEFCVLLPETSADNALNLAERLRLKIEKNLAVRDLSVTISLGVTEDKRDESPENFIDRVDALLYKSKENGRNRVSIG